MMDRFPPNTEKPFRLFTNRLLFHDDADAIQDVFDGKRFGHVYSRISNPSVSAFEQRVNSLENGRSAIAFSSGMAALHAVFLALVCRVIRL